MKNLNKDIMYSQKVEASRINDKVYFGNDDLIDNEMEIRKLLGNRFHLHTEISPSGIGYQRKWALYRKYQDMKVYLSDENKLIMNSNGHTEADLLDFAKRHHIKDLHETVHKISMVLSLLCLVITIVNHLLYHFDIIDKTLHTLIIGMNVGSIILVCIYNFANVKNEIYNSNVELEEMKQYLLSDNLE